MNTSKEPIPLLLPAAGCVGCAAEAADDSTRRTDRRDSAAMRRDSVAYPTCCSSGACEPHDHSIADAPVATPVPMRCA